MLNILLLVLTLTLLILFCVLSCDHFPREPLGLCLLVALIWPGPGETSLKSLVLLHFLWRPGSPPLSEADIGRAGVRGPGPTRELRGPRRPGVVGEGEGAGDIELEPSVCMEEEEV